MGRVHKNGACSCWAKMNKQLNKHNTQLSLSFSLTGRTYLNIATEKVESVRGRPKTVVASYCPMCGNKLELEASDE